MGKGEKKRPLKIVMPPVLPSQPPV